MNTKETEEQVNLLVPNCTCKYIRETQQGTWKCDQWEFTINGEKFDFFTGLGHRGLTEKAARVPATPHVITMLHSLFVDSQAATQPFKDWCEEDYQNLPTDSVERARAMLALCGYEA